MAMALTALALDACATAPRPKYPTEQPIAPPTVPPAAKAPPAAVMKPIPNPPQAPEPPPPEHPAKKPEPKATRKPAHPAPSVKADPAKAAKLRAQGLEQLDRGAVDRAVILLEQALALDPENNLIQRDLERARRIQEAVHAKP